MPLEVGTDQLEAPNAGEFSSAPSSSDETHAQPARAFSLEADEPRKDSVRQGLTLEMSGGLKRAQHALERPLDRRVRLGEG